MKYFIFLLFSVTQLSGQILVDTFPLPYSNVNNSMWGISEFENILYLGEDFNGNIHRMSKDGNLIDIIDVDDIIDFNHGLSYDGVFFYIVEDYTTGGASVFVLDGAGNIQESFVLPPVNGGNSSGVGSLFKDGNTLWYTVYYPDFDEYPYNYAYQLDLDTKTLIDTIPLNGAQVYGFTIKENEVVYVTDDLDGDEERIYVQNKTTDEILYSFPLEDPDGDSSPRGLHWDGSYLWLLANRPGSAAFAYKMVYQYELASSSGPSYSTDSDTIDFKLVDVDQNQIKPLLVENTGTENLVISDILITDPAFSFVSNLPILIEPNASKSLNFQFQPTEAKQYESTASITSNSIAADKSIILLGEGQLNSASIELNSQAFQIHPNPITENYFWLTANQEDTSIKSIKFFDVHGLLIHEINAPDQHLLDVSVLSDGFYTMQINTADNRKILFKIIISR